MKILKFPHADLFKECPKIEVFGPELIVLLDSMWNTMIEANGIGLAANQVGLIFRMFVMQSTNGRLNVINPIVLSKSNIQADIKEGCLSATGEYLIIPGRSKWIKLQYQDEKGEINTVILEGIYSVCAQHELEHLDGKSFMQNKSILKSIRKKLAKKWNLK